jgi:hypothetical protein
MVRQPAPRSLGPRWPIAPPDATVQAMQPHPWLKPLHRRIATTALCAAWVGVEVYLEPGGLWFWIALAATGYALWDFFLSGNYRNTTN